MIQLAQNTERLQMNSVVVWGGMKRDGEDITKWQKKNPTLQKVMGTFIILIFLIVSQVYIYVQLIKHFKCV